MEGALTEITMVSLSFLSLFWLGKSQLPQLVMAWQKNLSFLSLLWLLVAA